MKRIQLEPISRRASLKGLGALALATVVEGGGTAATPGGVGDSCPVPDFSHFANVHAASAAAIPSNVIHCRTGGYHSAGDGGGALYIRVPSRPLHALRFRSADRYSPSGSVDSENGGWWSWADNTLTPEMSGAKGDADVATWAGTDDWQAIQDALDAHIFFHVATEVCFWQSKSYRVTKSLRLGNGVGAPICARVRGPGLAHCGKKLGGGPVIMCDFADAPGVAIQGGRSVRWKGVDLKGRHDCDPVNKQMRAVDGSSVDNAALSNWVDASLNDEAPSPYVPHAAFAIDNYAGERPAKSQPDLSLPSFVRAAVQSGTASSSDILIEHVWIAGFLVALANQPCDGESKGVRAKLRSVAIEPCEYGICIGKTGFPDLSIRDVSLGSAS